MNSPPLGEFRNVLFAVLKRRLPHADAEDVAQATLTEAIESSTMPSDADAQKRWLWGVARNKVADHFRRSSREIPHDTDAFEGSSEPAEADLLEWAERVLPPGKDARQTFEWLIREGDGEDLASIAESAKIPAPRVRKRVSRMREHFRDHWKKEVALLAALGVALGWFLYARGAKQVPEIIAEKPQVPAPWVKERSDALERCRAEAWKECIEGLDHAAKLDPAGDNSEEVQKARKAAGDALAPKPVLPPPVPPPSATHTSQVLTKAGFSIPSSTPPTARSAKKPQLGSGSSL